MSLAPQVLKQYLGTWAPSRPPLTHRQFAPLTRLPGGPLKGTSYDPSTDPVQSWLIDQLDAGRWRRIYWAAPPQVAGKTQTAVLIPAMRAVVELRAAVGYGLPTLSDLDRGWQTKVAPTIRDAGLGDYLPEKGPGSRGGRPPSVTFECPDTRAPLGSFIFLAGGAKQVTCQVVVVDELDAWRTADGEPRWNDLEDVWARADSFGDDALRIGVGTVETDDPKSSVVLACVHELGTGTRLWGRCPHCASFAPLEFSCLVYEYQTTGGAHPGPDLKHAARTAAYACPGCATRWSEDDRRAAILAARFAHKGQTVDASGQVQGPAPATDSLGLRTSALDCILTTMGAIAERHAAARYALEMHANHEPMRKFYRYQRVEVYAGDLDTEGRHQVIDHRELADRSRATAWSVLLDERDEARRWSRYWAADLPAAASFAIPAIDVQRNRLYTGAVGFGEDRQTWDLAWGIESARAGTSDDEPPPFGPGELHATLSRAADWLEARLGDLFRVGVVDTGDQPDELAKWLATRPRWIGCRGTGRRGSESIQGDPGLPRVSAGSERTDYDGEVDGLICWERRWKPGLGRWVIASTTAWRSFQAAMRVPPGTAGAANLPGPLKAGNSYLRHLTARADVPNKQTGVITFRDTAGRHDWGDCRAYATAVGMAILTTGRDRVHTAQRPPASTPTTPKPSGWMSGFGGKGAWI
ncbi:MAG: hypothetical protein RLZZ524_607 [Pseudomonadota bacterium]